MDLPSGRKQHVQPVPRVGGMALVGCLMVGEFTGLLCLNFSWTQWILLLVVAAVGVLDDRHNLRASFKAWVSLGVALTLAFAIAYRIQYEFANFSFLGWVFPGNIWFLGGLLLVLFWATPHALNLIDGANGLLLGYVLIALVAMGGFASSHIFLVGTLLGLMVLNWPYSRLFMGDCGALVLGFLVALKAQSTFTPDRLESVLWVLAYPAVDVAMVITIRLMQRRSLGDGDRNHLHHQWKEVLGRHARWRVPLLWLQAGLCASGVWLSGAWVFLPLTGVIGLIGSAIYFVNRTYRQGMSVSETSCVGLATGGNAGSTRE